MTTTSTDKPFVNLTTTDRATHVADAPHLDQPIHRRPRTTTRRAAITAALALALAATVGLALAVFGSDGTDTSVNRVADSLPHIQESSQAEAVQTELVVNGVPTWWARAGWPVESDDARDQPQAVQTDLVVNGVPTWWARAGWPVERRR